MKVPASKLLLTVTLFLLLSLGSQSPLSAQTTGGGTFTIENYYKVKWGFADEFIALWKTNHYPLLQKAKANGDIIAVVAEKPKLHSSEDSRWDFRVIITFKNIDKAFDPALTEPYKKALYPDLEKLKKDEQHRFELLISHWDIPTEKVALN